MEYPTSRSARFMKLEHEIQKYVETYEGFDPLTGDDARNPLKLRERYRRLVREIESDAPTQVEFEDALVKSPSGDIPVRIYRTHDRPDQPCCLFYHGGGWILGDLDTHHTWAADLCAQSGATVIATHYRVAPEHPYPAAFDDSYAVLADVIGNGSRYGIDPRRIVVYGDSAGGNLCAAIALKARDRGLSGLAGQVLIYPALHFGEPLPSWLRNDSAPVLGLDALKACWRAYLGGGQADEYAAPLLASNFEGLPPAWIVTAEHDPLRDDGLLFAERLGNVGVGVEVLDVEGLVHGCFRVRHVSPTTRNAFQWSVRAVRSAHAAGF